MTLLDVAAVIGVSGGIITWLVWLLLRWGLKMAAKEAERGEFPLDNDS